MVLSSASYPQGASRLLSPSWSSGRGPNNSCWRSYSRVSGPTWSWCLLSCQDLPLIIRDIPWGVPQKTEPIPIKCEVKPETSSASSSFSINDIKGIAMKSLYCSGLRHGMRQANMIDLSKVELLVLQLNPVPIAILDFEREKNILDYWPQGRSLAGAMLRHPQWAD